MKYKGILFIIYGKKNEINFYRKVGKYLLNNNIDYKLIVIDLFSSQNKQDCEVFLEQYDSLDDIKFDNNFSQNFYYFYQDRFINELSYQSCYGQYNANYDELVKAFIKVSNFAYETLNKYKDYLIYSGAPDNYFANIFILMAEYLNRKYFWLEKSYWCDGYTFFSDKEYTNDIFKGYIKVSINKDLEYLKQFFSKTAIKQNPNLFQYPSILSKMKSNIFYLLNYFEYKKYEKEKIIFIPWINYPWINDFKNKLCRNLKRSINKVVYDIKSLSLKKIEILSKKYNILFFPLHYQPEAATLTMQPFFNNQYFLIKVIADMLPPNWILLVKEHPIQDLGLRKLNFYYDISYHKNVFLVNKFLTIEELEPFVSKIITIGGTLGFESVMKGKDVAVFSNVYYSNYKDIFKINFNLYDFDFTKKQLFNFLNNKINILEKEKLTDFLNKYYFSIIQFPFEKTIEEIIKNSHKYFV